MSDLVSEIPSKSAGKVSIHESIPGDLKLSQYAVIIDNYPQNGKHLLFSTFTHALVNIEDDLKNFISKPDYPIGEDTLEHIRTLKEMGILVSRRLDETKIAREWYDISRSDMSRIHATILTTYDCNFACKYCIEEGVKKRIYMDDERSDALVEWLVNTAEENRTKEISVLFYGGEPLLNTRPMYRISEKLHDSLAESKVSVSSSITTNGSLINGKLLQYLTKYGLRSIKVTIDGVKEIHDARRPFKSGRGSFDIIMRNIQKVPETVELTIQTNLDSENMGSFPRLLEYFESSGLKDRINNLTISPVSQSLGSESTPAILQEKSCMRLPDSRTDGDLIYAKRLAAERGFRLRADTVKHKICSMNRSGSLVTIDPLGDIYSCPAFVGRRGLSVGSIHRAKLDRSQEFPVDKLEGCFQCTYFPVCSGGCRYAAYMLYGDHNRIACEREAIEYQTKELIKLGYDQRKKQRKSA